jgi:hypothetical protein
MRLLACVLTATLTTAILWIPLKLRIFDLLDPYALNGDAYQHLAPMWFARQSPDTISDYTMRYYLTAIIPAFFKWLYAGMTIWFEPAAASKVLTVILSLAFIGLSTACSLRLAGGAAAALSFFLATAGVVRNMFFMGGIQRGFGFCLASLALYFVIQGRLVALAVVAVISAGFYPAASIYMICALGLLVILPEAYRGTTKTWGLSRRLALVTTTGALACLVVLPLILNGKNYGERLSRAAESEYQEWGSAGRYNQGDRGVSAGFLRKTFFSTLSSIYAPRLDRALVRETDVGDLELSRDIIPTMKPVLVMVLTVALAGFTLFRSRLSLSPQALRCAIFFCAMLISFFAAKIFFPILYIPSRYLILGVVSLTPIAFPAIWSNAFSKNLRSGLRNFIIITFGALLLYYLGWTSLQIRRFPSVSGNRSLFNFIKTLPEDVVIASWPRGVANYIPLFTKRSVLVFEEGHQVFHRDFLEEMRRRTRALIAAYSAIDEKPFITLNRDYNVSYLLIQRSHLRELPDYFAPFGYELKTARSAIGDQRLFLRELIEKHAVFNSGDHILVDINLKTAVKEDQNGAAGLKHKGF